MRRLIHYPLCPHSRSIRLALGELRLEFDLAYEEPWAWRPAFLAINPSGALPVLQLDYGLTLCGTYAIAEFLADTYPEHPADGGAPPVLPGDFEARAEVRRLVDWFHQKFHREVSGELLTEKHYQRALGPRARPPDSAVLRAVAKNLRYHLEYVCFLADHRNWLAGDDLSFADLAAGAHVSVLDYLGEIDWQDYPSAANWYVRLKSRPAFHPLLEDYLPSQPPAAHYAELDH